MTNFILQVLREIIGDVKTGEDVKENSIEEKTLMGKIKKLIDQVEKKAKSRLMPIEFVEKSFNELLDSDYEEIRVDSGALPNSYKYPGESTYVWMCRDGRFKVTRSSAVKCSGGRGPGWTFRHTNKQFEDKKVN